MRAVRIAIASIGPALLAPAVAPGGDYRLAVDRERIDQGPAWKAGEMAGTRYSERPGEPAGIEIELGRDAGAYVSPAVEAELPFNEALMAWNIARAEGAGFAASVRFARADGSWSAWYHLGRFGSHPKVEGAVTEDAGGKVDVDCFAAKGLYSKYQYRVSFVRGASGVSPRLDRVQVLVSNTTDDRKLHDLHARPARPRTTGALSVNVPFRSQRAEDPAIAGRICSPTSVAMVLSYRGIERPTAEVAARALDADHDIYGNWPANVQAAYSYGVPGKLARFRSWDAARVLLEAGQPIVISIRDTKGVLKAAPYARTDGHLLVLTGFDDAGNPRVNDPAARDAERGVTAYDRAQMEEVWLARGGLGYVIEGR
jgi:hypothetical protein